MTDDQEARRKLVAYGVQRGRARALKTVVHDLDHLIDDQDVDVDVHTLKTLRDKLKNELDVVRDHVYKMEKEAASRRQAP